MDIIVWIIDDIESYRITIKELIDEADGMRCTGVFPSCEQAIDALNEGDGVLPDIILMDIALEPNMNGVDGTRIIKSIMPSVQVIMLTIHADDSLVFDALRAGAAGYLLKEDMDRILGGIRDADRGGVPMTGSIARKVLSVFQEQEDSEIDYKLTRREKEVLTYLVEGVPQRKIAEILFISPNTVDTHVRNIYAKLHVNSRARVVAKALNEGLVKIK